MKKLLTPAAFALGLIASSAALAGEKTVTLAVRTCFARPAPHREGSLEAVPGVAKVAVSYQEKTAIRDLRR